MQGPRPPPTQRTAGRQLELALTSRGEASWQPPRSSGGPARWSGVARDLPDLLAQLARAYGEQPGAFGHIEYWDADFEEWCGPFDVSQLPSTATICIFPAATAPSEGVPPTARRSAVRFALRTSDLDQQVREPLSPLDVRARLVEIFGRHNPRKLAVVDQLLCEWLGQERQLLDNVERK
jgi:hypothetical protein|eukprot:COSAG01_NODE_16980_length_1188_cov_3.122130_1_plen_179_part_00